MNGVELCGKPSYRDGLAELIQITAEYSKFINIRMRLRTNYACMDML